MLANVLETSKDCEKLTKQREGLNYTASEIKDILCQPQYATTPVYDRTKLSIEESKNVRRYEDINSFGADVADLFEDLCEELHRIPTQDEFVTRGVALTEEWWIRETLKGNPHLRGLHFENEVIEACKDRQKRSYLSLVNELYTASLLKEVYPEDKVITHDMLDLVLGVDIVLEHGNKRLYIHVFKNSYWGMKGFERKESRGGMKNKDGKFVKFHRNFAGDICFVYDTTDTDTTEIVNGIPLFTRDYIEWSIDRAIRNKSIGENINTSNSKLEKLNNWLFENFETFISFE